eukprot:TRINITY_DN7522_c0_g1_i1.p1 TRINITY_DN7522_c0_g1~~TRINITY_DN7522_c0_g1_i1.p1  ORF type:complete len:385 (-),score=86.75 TRINITY_DN7522_c0_g1_i1:356-1510(-)
MRVVLVGIFVLCLAAAFVECQQAGQTTSVADKSSDALLAEIKANTKIVEGIAQRQQHNSESLQALKGSQIDAPKLMASIDASTKSIEKVSASVSELSHIMPSLKEVQAAVIASVEKVSASPKSSTEISHLAAELKASNKVLETISQTQLQLKETLESLKKRQDANTDALTTSIGKLTKIVENQDSAKRMEELEATLKLLMTKLENTSSSSSTMGIFFEDLWTRVKADMHAIVTWIKSVIGAVHSADYGKLVQYVKEITLRFWKKTKTTGIHLYEQGEKLFWQAHEALSLRLKTLNLPAKYINPTVLSVLVIAGLMALVVLFFLLRLALRVVFYILSFVLSTILHVFAALRFVLLCRMCAKKTQGKKSGKKAKSESAPKASEEKN